MAFQFPPVEDRTHFPMVVEGNEEVLLPLMGCDGLMFAATNDPAMAAVFGNRPGVAWHLYGDVRWPAKATWCEFPLPSPFVGIRAGVLAVLSAIPDQESDPLLWAAQNHPLASIGPWVRDPAPFMNMWGPMATSTEWSAEPVTNRRPAFVQGYSIYMQFEQEVTFVAWYTDILNDEGIPLVLYRVSNAEDDQAITFSRLALHTLFRHNEGRIRGTPFVLERQLKEFRPAALSGDAPPPHWTRFHPTRSLRLRPAVRAIATPALKDGFLEMKDFENIGNLRMRELNRHLLAFEREIRPREMALQQQDSNTTMNAFAHRAHGGAIFVLPDLLVEEFYHTDCSEVCLTDLKFPFPNVFLSFRPPEELRLGLGVVDGCYVVRQGDEVCLIVTSRFEGVSYTDSLSIACVEPTFSLHMPATIPSMTLVDAVEAGIADFLEKNAPPEKDESKTFARPDGEIVTITDVRRQSRRRRIEEFRSQESAFRACLNIVINGMCFIEFRPEDVSESWAGEPPAEVLAAAALAPASRKAIDKAAGARRRLANGDYTKIKVCGRSLFPEASSSAEGPDVDGDGKGPSPRAHWRRGHWRRQRHGAGLTLIGLRWIRPTVVKKGNNILDTPRDSPTVGA